MEIPAGLGLKDMAILGRRGSHSLLQRGALSVLLRGGVLSGWQRVHAINRARSFTCTQLATTVLSLAPMIMDFIARDTCYQVPN